MKNLPYIRYFLIIVIYIPMWFLNIPMNLLYFITGTTNTIRRKKTPILIWFINTDEDGDTANNYGDLENRIKWGIEDIESRNVFVRFWWFWIWNVIRNSFFYFKMHVWTPIPEKINEILVKVKKNTSGKHKLYTMKYEDRGVIHITYLINDEKYFRYSHTKVIWFFGKKIWNVQLGASGIVNESGIEDTNRYVLKSKMQIQTEA